jgi:hypothetical protein
MVIAAEALRLAEDELSELPKSPRVGDLHRRVAALKSVLHGVVREILTGEQHQRIASDALALASEVFSYRSRAAG